MIINKVIIKNYKCFRYLEMDNFDEIRDKF